MYEQVVVTGYEKFGPCGVCCIKELLVQVVTEDDRRRSNLGEHHCVIADEFEKASHLKWTNAILGSEDGSIEYIAVFVEDRIRDNNDELPIEHRLDHRSRRTRPRQKTTNNQVRVDDNPMLTAAVAHDTAAVPLLPPG